MRAGIVCLRTIAVAALVAFMPSCAPGAFSDFGLGNCRTVYVLSGGVVRPVDSCGGVPREGLMAWTAAAGNDLPALLAAPKFEPDAHYGGAETPADRGALSRAVNDAVRDLIAMPAPRDALLARQRLAAAVRALEGFATEDRKHAHMYLVLAWRAAGLSGETGLFSSDEQILGVF